ncbi:SEL1-like repeat protein [Neorhizobium sp. NCHU2750]|uniref:SEL1-like repeat protein n=1 Tax=Neorhizobium sp. NCHU2750 TaxID=1825976 RepID=UPI000EB696AC|nr:Sel1 repeat protein [Neorhizobium sp. NCHU2750]
MLIKYAATLADRMFEKRLAGPGQKKRWDGLYQVPVKELEARAKAGEADAAFVLGDMFDQGSNGVTRDLVIALDWYHHAAKLGHGDAMNNIGSMYEHGDGPLKIDLDKARDYYEKGTKAGCGTAANNLGHFYAKGVAGLKQNQRKAFKLFRKGAGWGDGNAMIGLGLRYEEGRGTRRHPIRAVYWYRRAMQEGKSGGAQNLGVAYHRGSFVRANPKKAVALFREALPGGMGNTPFMLALAYERGSGVERDLSEALYYFRMADDRGYKAAAEGIDRVLAAMGEEFSTALAPEDRLEDLRQMIRDPNRTFSVQALLLELARVCEQLVDDKGNPAADTPYVLGKSTMIRGFVLWKQGNPEHEGPVETALAIDEKHPFMTPGERVSLLTSRAVTLGRHGKWDEAIALHRRVLAILEKDPPPEEVVTLGAMVDLAYCLHENDEFDEAQRVNAEVLSRAERAFGMEDTRLLRVLSNLAQNEFALDRPERSVALLKQRLAIAEKEGLLEVIDETLRDLAIASFHIGERDEAEQLFRRRIALVEKNGDSRDIEQARRDLEELFSRE